MLCDYISYSFHYRKIYLKKYVIYYSLLIYIIFNPGKIYFLNISY